MLRSALETHQLINNWSKALGKSVTWATISVGYLVAAGCGEETPAGKTEASAQPAANPAPSVKKKTVRGPGGRLAEDADLSARDKRNARKAASGQ